MDIFIMFYEKLIAILCSHYYAFEHYVEICIEEYLI
jgi:hypothetical protein